MKDEILSGRSTMLVLVVLHTLCHPYHHQNWCLLMIAGNENIAAKDRIAAEAASCEVALAITKLAFEGPIVLKNFAAYLR
jgi:hypothetical protein